MEAAADLQDTASLAPKFEFNPKLGIDNPVLSLAEDHEPSDLWSLERPRFYLLNREEGRSFGFHLQQQRGRAGHVVCRVEPGASAQRQGLREGDRILGVNNHVVEHEDYSVVIRRIRASGPRVLLTVLAQHVHEVALAQRGNDAHLCPTLGRGVRPRLCHVVKDEGGFGFSITQGHRGPFWLVLSTGGAAERAGVPPGARLLEVNGVSVEKFTHNQLSKKLWQSGKQVTLLVAGPEVEEQCRQLGMPLAAPLAEGWALPTKPRCLHLEKGPQGFGFMLREEKGLDGRLAPGQPPGVHTVAWAGTGGQWEGAVRMSASQVSSCGRWTQDCQRRRPGCRLGTGWWLWLGRAWKGWAMKRQCPRSGRRAPASRSLSLTLRLTASSTWFACPHFSSWRAQRLPTLPRIPAQPLWLRPRTHQLKTQPSPAASASASCTLGLAVAMASDSAVWPVGLISSSPR
ncbi:Na(+)/H(+) exchange regulatory cofactor NHE-RF4 isoform X2 [Balaenoptera musculus]|uniref:Na(+)/H(+) exchange regulatory cofactor NHE-RF4 isoform X2 n=1 Tax=Balaenoptera musculus TaxID=9771 RepID=A0A8B8Y1D8_BALMU|nr:Na(+)/H(+) exchange regulatory cofactor NHE-RF4 isoform X2 [Balaenoptera musculus]